MTQTHFGCSHSDLWVNPENWKTTTAKTSLQKDWYVQCYFFDPAFAAKYPRGFPYRCKLNKGNDTLEKRKAAVQMMLEEMPALLAEGFNPITKSFMPVAGEEPLMEAIPEYNTDTPLCEALDLAIELCAYKGEVLKDAKRIIKYCKMSAEQLHFSTLPISKFSGIHLKKILDNIKVTKQIKGGAFVEEPLSENRYNKFLGYLPTLLGLLVTNGLTLINAAHGVSKFRVEVERREVMTMAQRRLVDAHLKVNYPSFWLFLQVFFHSAGRELEMLNLKYEHIDLDNLTYVTLIKKRKVFTWVERPIKIISLPYWEKAMIGAKKGDYIFSVGLKPGTELIRRDQITRRWREHVKIKLGITADIYSAKHSNLTEISERTTAKVAARAAGHANERMVRKHYDTTIEAREMNAVRHMTNQFAPPQQLNNENDVCYNAPASFFKL